MNRRWVVVARIEDLREGRGRRCRFGDDEIALWLVNGCCYAISAVCAHQHVATLHEGIREGLAVSCPLHGWTYSLETGQSVRGDGRVRSFPVKVEGGEISIGVDDGA